MAAVTIHQAKTNLSKLIAQAEAGEEVVIMRGKDPVVRLMPVQTGKPRLMFGMLKGKRVPGMLKGKMPDLPDAFFFDPLPEDELRAWEGEEYEGPR
jgi:prevent-host-death family protein